jgi:hypothetical protein
VASQFLRRDSRGWDESVVGVWLRFTEGPTPARRVSWRPGAEGAPVVRWARWEWEVEWVEGGEMRIAWRRG